MIWIVSCTWFGGCCSVEVVAPDREAAAIRAIRLMRETSEAATIIIDYIISIEEAYGL